jgi:hypothetical protein
MIIGSQKKWPTVVEAFLTDKIVERRVLCGIDLFCLSDDLLVFLVDIPSEFNRFPMKLAQLYQ